MWIREERPQFVLEWGKSFRAVPERISGKLLLPELPNSLVCYVTNCFLEICLVVEESRDVREGCGRLIKKREEHVPENVLQPWAPCRVPDFLEGLKKTGSDERSEIRPDRTKRVKSKRAGWVGGVEVEEVGSLGGRKSCGDTIHGVTVRVKEGKSTSRSGVLKHEVFEERGFACTGLTDDVDMMAAGVFRDPERTPAIAPVGSAEDGEGGSRYHMIIFSRKEPHREVVTL